MGPDRAVDAPEQHRQLHQTRRLCHKQGSVVGREEVPVPVDQTGEAVREVAARAGFQ